MARTRIGTRGTELGRESTRLRVESGSYHQLNPRSKSSGWTTDKAKQNMEDTNLARAITKPVKKAASGAFGLAKRVWERVYND